MVDRGRLVRPGRGRIRHAPRRLRRLAGRRPNGHCLINRTDRPRASSSSAARAGEVVTYSDIDLMVTVRDGAPAFTRRDGTPLAVERDG